MQGTSSRRRGDDRDGSGTDSMEAGVREDYTFVYAWKLPQSSDILKLYILRLCIYKTMIIHARLRAWDNPTFGPTRTCSHTSPAPPRVFSSTSALCPRGARALPQGGSTTRASSPHLLNAVFQHFLEEAVCPAAGSVGSLASSVFCSLPSLWLTFLFWKMETM